MDNQDDKMKVLEDLREAVKELNLVLAGEKEARNADDLLDELSEHQQKSVMTGLEQADRGETISHIEAITRLGL